MTIIFGSVISLKSISAPNKNNLVGPCLATYGKEVEVIGEGGGGLFQDSSQNK